ncbi:SRPBCC family protein [Streptomyces sp. NPDC127084]|uniref:SRPBCC family protein n=1 Tax=Streptomyces sp. NPDC127084 TaxID=3347133 RepID=UPI0036645488
MNWKAAVENGAESYHHMGTHAGALEPVPPGKVTVLHECEGRWFSAFMPFAPTAAEAMADDMAAALSMTIPGLGEAELSGMLIAGVFPQLMPALLPTGATCFRWIPTGPGTHDAHATVPVPRVVRQSPDSESYLRLSRVWPELIQGEDLIAIRGSSAGWRPSPSRPAGASRIWSVRCGSSSDIRPIV